MACQFCGSREDAESSLMMFLMLSSIDTHRGRNLSQGTVASLVDVLNSDSRLATVVPSGSLRAFTLGQILNTYAIRYKRPFAFSAFPYPRSHQVALRLPYPHNQQIGAVTEAAVRAYHVPMSVTTPRCVVVV